MEEEDSRGKALGSLRSIFKVYSKGKGMLLKGLSKGLSRTKFRLAKITLAIALRMEGSGEEIQAE